MKTFFLFSAAVISFFTWSQEVQTPVAPTPQTPTEIQKAKVIDKPVDQLSLEDLLNINVSVGTKKAISARKTPGIVMVITDEEIRNSGARDLTDVLSLVPGLSFGVDVTGVVGLGVRGNWAHEGKFLLIWDGIEMNEIDYASVFFGNHYPVDQIKRIEIIRGPGSVIYGGFAELAVINVVTKKGAEINGAEIGAKYGRMEKIDSRANFTGAFGFKNQDYDVSLSQFSGHGNRSDRSFENYSLKDNSALDPEMLNFALSSKKNEFSRYL